jgi:ATP-dependent Clp protease ATP-binding subunit ClpA
MTTTTRIGNLTPRAQRLVERAGAKAQSLDIGAIGVEHLLFAMLDDPNSVAFRVLKGHADIDALRADLTAEFESEGYQTGSTLRYDRDGNLITDD